MEIYVIEAETLERLGVVDTYKSFLWKTAYNGVGSFELRCPIKYIELLQTDRLIQCTADLKHNGIIEHIIKLTEDDGSETLTVNGRMAEVLLERRICKGAYKFESMQPAQICSSLITSNAISNRPIQNLTIGSIVNADEGVISYSGSNESLLSEVQKICKIANLGFRLYANTETKRLICDIYKGVNRTSAHNTVTHISENNASNSLNNGFFSSGTSGWVEHGNSRGFDFVAQKYRSDYPLKASGGTVRKSRVYDYVDEGNKKYIEYNPSPYITQNVNLDSNHIYYIAVSCYNPLDAVISFGIKQGEELQLNFTKSSAYVRQDMIFVPGKSGAHTFYAGYGELPEEENKWVYWDYCILLDLTATFGPGKEPGYDYCSNNIYYSGDILKYKTQTIEFIPNYETPLVFSRDRDTLISVEYEKTIVNECTHLFIMGQDGIETDIKSAERSGIKLKEKHISLSIPRRVDNIEIPIPSYIEMLKNAGKAALRQLVVNEMVDGTLYKLSNVQYGKQFSLGDIAEFTDAKLKKKSSLRISAATQIWDSTGYSITVTLGDDIPNIVETIKLVAKGAK